MTPEQIVLPIMRGVGNRPRLSKKLFRFAKWGDPFAPQRFSDPYSVYAKMTADGPVVRSRMYNQWFVSGHAEVLEVLRSPHVSTSTVIERMLPVAPFSELGPAALSSFTRWLLVNDPPDHTRLRNAVNRAFTPKRIRAMEPQIREITDSLLTELDGVETCDIVSTFTTRLPIYAIGQLLGLPTERWEWLKESSAEIGGLLELLNDFDAASMNRRFEELNDFFSELADQRRSAPRDDLISDLVAAEQGVALSTEEVVAMIGLLMFGGHETTSGFLGNSIVALAQYPDQRTLLRAHPDIVENAVEELLRFESPVQFTGRATTESITVGGHTIPAGQSIALMVGAANRDLRRWPDANELRLDRPDPRPISFGHGIHHCLGASLARLEARVAIPRFVEAFGDYAINLESVKWKRSHSTRGPTELVITRQ